MNSGELLVSVDTLIRIFLFLLYAPVVLISYRWLMPRLSPTSRRLASAMLAAQILVIVIALEIRPASLYEKWLWNLDREWNIPSTLASTQLALVGGLALMTAWLAKARPAWQRLYLVGIGLAFLFLAQDEYFTIHENIRNWKDYYTALAAVVVVVTAAVAVRSPRRAWIWHLCLLTGLAISAAGAIGLERRPPACGSFGVLHLDGCLYFFWFEETLEFLGIWVTLLAILGQFSDTAPPPPHLATPVYHMLALWIFLLFLHSLVPRLELQHLTQPAAVQFEKGIHLHGYHIDSGEEAIHIRLYAYARQRDYIKFGVSMGYSVHLVDQASGESVVSSTKLAGRRHGFWLFGPDYMSIHRQQMEVEIPPGTPANRAFWVVLALWHRQGDEYAFQKIITSDHQLLDDTQVILGELALPASDADGQP